MSSFLTSARKGSQFFDVVAYRLERLPAVKIHGPWFDLLTFAIWIIITDFRGRTLKEIRPHPGKPDPGEDSIVVIAQAFEDCLHQTE